MGGKLPWGGTGIYIQSYTFYGDMPCKPDSAAASKGFKGKGKDWEVGRLPRALKGREFKTTTLCKYTSMYIRYNPGGLISIIPVIRRPVKLFLNFLCLYENKL